MGSMGKYASRRIKNIFSFVLGPSIQVETHHTISPIKSNNDDSLNPNWWHNYTSRHWVVSETKNIILLAVL